MKNNIPRTRVARQTAITRILANQNIRSQADLQKALAEQGIETTQATLSRDLFDLRATKIRGENGHTTYAIAPPPESSINGPENGGISRCKKWCQDLLVVAINSGNFALLRTPAGAAQLLASSLDNAIFPEMLGTVAGDDTIFVMCTDPEAAKNLVQRLLAFAESPSASTV